MPAFVPLVLVKARGAALGLVALLFASGCSGTPVGNAPDADGLDGGVGDAGADAGSPTVHLRGGVQKGPFILGSSVAISPVDGVGNPTGAVFSTMTFNDVGDFGVDFDYLGAVSLEARGFYYNEISGVSHTPLTLRAFHEVSSGGAQGAYLNIITHLTYGRTRQLASAGSTIAAATTQAESELRAELGIGPPGFTPEAPGIYLNELGGDTDSNAYLLAVSAILCSASAGTDSALQELINTISADFEIDGRLETALKTRLHTAALLVDGDAIMAMMRARLVAVGSDATVPNVHRMLDNDDDGTFNIADNCVELANAGQENRDGDAWGDACDEGALEPQSTLVIPGNYDGHDGLAVGDLDGDGDLDLVGAGAYSTSTSAQIFTRDLDALATSPWAGLDSMFSVALGDVDGDGDLDIASGGRQAQLFLNDGGVSGPIVATWQGPYLGFVTCVAWGDFDGDGDVDLAAGGPDLATRLYRNDAGTLVDDPWRSALVGRPRSLAWGDVDGDGDPDLVTGGTQSMLYRNDAGTLTTDPAWVSTDVDPTGAGDVAAWGDIDGDGDLDLAAGSRLYRNDSGTLTSTPVWIATDHVGSVAALAWGDQDGDGDLDLAIAFDDTGPHLYRNDAGTLTTVATWSEWRYAVYTGLAWVEVNGDGKLDLAAASPYDSLTIYRTILSR